MAHWIEQTRGEHRNLVWAIIKAHPKEMNTETAWKELSLLYKIANNGEECSTFEQELKMLDYQSPEQLQGSLHSMIHNWFSRYANCWSAHVREDETMKDACRRLEKAYGGQFEVLYEY